MTAPRAGVARAVPQTTIVAKNIQKLLTLSAHLGELDDAAVFVQGNVIQWVGKTADLPAEYQKADEVLDLSDRVVMPGMVNSHHHMCAACLDVCDGCHAAVCGMSWPCVVMG